MTTTQRVQHWYQFNPTRFFAAILGFGQALIVVFQLIWVWDAQIVLAINTAWVALIAIPMTFIRSESTTIVTTDPPQDAGHLEVNLLLVAVICFILGFLCGRVL